MKRLDLQFKEIDYDKFRKRSAALQDVKTFIWEDTIIYVDGVPVVLYASLKDFDTSALRWAVQSMKINKGKRSRGLQSESSVFGYSPRVPMRQDYCRISEMAKKYPKQHYIITNFINQVVELYQKYFPDVYAKHQEVVSEKILEEYKIGNTPFTSGVVNRNNQLKYHFDYGNFEGMLSNMVVFKKGVDGGHLCIPALDIALEVGDNTITIFNGQDILHGVSDINFYKEGAYRYSVVYYSLEQMWKCEPLDDEVLRLRETKSVKEHTRLDPEHLEYLQKKGEKLKRVGETQKNITLEKNKLKDETDQGTI